MEFADIHCHILADADDGAENDERMYAMLRAAYADGTRSLCFTPHFEPETFDCTRETIEKKFKEVCLIAAELFPALTLYLGNEISYRGDSLSRLSRGEILPIADGRYVLLDFLEYPRADIIFRALDSFCCAGYIPIVAHVERYPCLKGKRRELTELAEKGAVYQINATSILHPDKRKPERQMAEKLLSLGLADVVASDAHDVTSRPPLLSGCYDAVAAKYGKHYADYLFCINPTRILNNKTIH